MTQRLRNKVALVTGAGSGIGEAVSKRFAEEDAHVLVTDIKAESAERVADEIVKRGGKATARAQDVCEEGRWDELMDEILANHGQLDILVNNAGLVVVATVEETSLEMWRKTQAVNVEGVFLGCRAAIRAMKEKGGSIINLSSIEGLIGEPLVAAYNASKGAVRLFTKSVALHCAKQGYAIRVNSVHPGCINTPLLAGAFASMTPELSQETMERVMRDTPFGSAGEPLDIAHGCLFLGSDESRYMTGSELVIDGGYTCH